VSASVIGEQQGAALVGISRPIGWSPVALSCFPGSRSERLCGFGLASCTTPAALLSRTVRLPAGFGQRWLSLRTRRRRESPDRPKLGHNAVDRTRPRANQLLGLSFWSESGPGQQLLNPFPFAAIACCRNCLRQESQSAGAGAAAVETGRGSACRAFACGDVTLTKYKVYPNSRTGRASSSMAAAFPPRRSFQRRLVRSSARHRPGCPCLSHGRRSPSAARFRSDTP